MCLTTMALSMSFDMRDLTPLPVPPLDHDEIGKFDCQILREEIAPASAKDKCMTPARCITLI